MASPADIELEGFVDDTANSIPPTLAELCLSSSLYAPYEITNASYLERLKEWSGTIDAHCPNCDKESVFGRALPAKGMARAIQLPEITSGRFDARFFCTRNHAHELYFLFEVRDRTLRKIGQSPSVADLAAAALHRYRIILTPSLYGEFNRAIGLAAHGVGIGAFTYLRRVFERLLDDAHERARATPGWDDGTYTRVRVAEKIVLLRGHLPRFLVEHASMYGILSLGIHELSEAACLEVFPVVRGGIELILDERIAQRESDEKVRATSAAISNVSKRLKPQA